MVLLANLHKMMISRVISVITVIVVNYDGCLVDLQQRELTHQYENVGHLHPVYYSSFIHFLDRYQSRGSNRGHQPVITPILQVQ